MLNRMKTLTFFLLAVSFLSVPMQQGRASCREGISVKSLKQRMIRAGYEENTEDFQTGQMFRDIFQIATPLSPVSGLLHMVLTLLPSSCSGMLCPLPSPTAGGNVLLFTQIKHFRHFLPVRQTLFVFLDSDCCVIQANGPHRTPALLPAFLLGSAHQDCTPSWLTTVCLPMAMAPKVPFLRHWLHLMRRILEKYLTDG